MAAPRALALVVALLAAAAPALAGGGGYPPPPGIEVTAARDSGVHPLPTEVRLAWPVAPPPATVSVCEDYGCDLFRRYDVGADGQVVVEQHPPFGPAFVGEHFLHAASATAPHRYSPFAAHEVALYGAFVVGAPQRATLVAGATGTQPTGGVVPVEATALLDDRPEEAQAFAGVVVAPDAAPSAELSRQLAKLVRRGGVLAVPRALEEQLAGLVAAVPAEPLVVDSTARLVELGSQRLLREGERALPVTARRAGGVVLVYDESQLSEGMLSDALLAAIPRFHSAPRLAYADPRESPASSAAGIAASRPAPASLLLLPLLVVVVLLVLAVRARRRRGVVATPAFVAVAVAAALLLVVVPRALDRGARVHVRTYVSFGDASVALEEGAVAERPASSGDVVTLTGPVGTLPRAIVRGIQPVKPQVIDVSDEGRTLGFPVHGDGVAVASWLRPVELDGLRVALTDGEWPRDPTGVVVENRLPFALDRVEVVRVDGGYGYQPLAAGARASSWGPFVQPWGEADLDGADPMALAKRRLLVSLRQRCRAWGPATDALACVIGVGTAPDGALVGVQVLSP